MKITEGDASDLYAEPSFRYGRPFASSQSLTNIKSDVIPLTVAARQYGYENASITATVEITHSATSEVVRTETLEDVQLPSTKGDAGDTFWDGMIYFQLLCIFYPTIELLSCHHFISLFIDVPEHQRYAYKSYSKIDLLNGLKNILAERNNVNRPKFMLFFSQKKLCFPVFFIVSL